MNNKQIGSESGLTFKIGGHTADGNQAIVDAAAGRLTPEMQSLMASTAESGLEKIVADSIRTTHEFTRGLTKGGNR